MPFQNFGRLWRHEHVSGGQVCIYGTGIAVEFLASRFAAGESIAELAVDYRIDHRDVEAAMRLVVASASSRRGLLAAVERRMEARIPLLQTLGHRR